MQRRTCPEFAFDTLPWVERLQPEELMCDVGIKAQLHLFSAVDTVNRVDLVVLFLNHAIPWYVSILLETAMGTPPLGGSIVARSNSWMMPQASSLILRSLAFPGLLG